MQNKAGNTKDNLEYVQAVFETIREPLVVLDKDLNVIMANRSYYKVFHTTKKETEHKSLYKLGTGQYDQPELRHLLENILPNKTFFQDFEMTQEFPEIGQRVFLLNARQLIQKGRNQPMVLLAIEDITEKKQLEQQKDDFISIASHELKTPVTSMKVYSHLLQKNPLITQDKKASAMLEKMDTQMNRLVQLVASFMNVYKLQTGQLILIKKLFQLDELLVEVVANFQYTVSSHLVDRTGTVKVAVKADREKINQVLVNLISNAIKYSPNADKVIVGLTADSRKATVSVQDFGMGIPKEEQSKIFDRFYRIKGKEENNIPGLGLGLFISAEIIKQHGGELWVNSDKGKGSTFNFTLPI